MPSTNRVLPFSEPFPMRVALYARVSTVRQAEADLSIPDQVRQAEAWCARQGYELVRKYIEPGASGTDETRPVFTEMLRDARASPKPFDIILVHSFSRFARDNFTYAIAKVSLKKAGILVQSITQPLNDDSQGEMIEGIIVNFDAYNSKEISKHTARGMKENARQGFWNGSKPPFGYSAVEAERRGEKIKKKLALLESEAGVVRRIFDLYRGVEGGQYGIKAIVVKLNAEGITFRGKPFMISNVHRILTNETYAGRHFFNVKDTKSDTVRPQADWIAVDVPSIITREVWEAVQTQLAERAPHKTPARIVNSPTLLTGIATCAHCGAGMTLRTGKGYRYYACAGRAQKGPTRCGGCAVPMTKVDEAVLSALSEQVFAPDRLADLVSGYLDQAKADAQLHRSKLGQLKSDLTETEGAIARLVGMVEAGLMEIEDPALAGRLNALKAKRAALQSQIGSASATEPSQKHRLTEAKLGKLSVAIRGALRTAPPEMCKAYIKLFVNNVVVSKKEIRVSGPKGVLAKAAMSEPPNTPGEVITFVREWRPVGDSNPCRRRERAVSWASRRTGRGLRGLNECRN